MPGRGFATAMGAVAVMLWGALALFTTATAGLPPLQVLFLSFSVAFLGGLVWLALRGRLSTAFLRSIPAAAWALGVGGLFLYHLAYFIALKNAPPAEASLIAYLWPLLIVLFSALLPGEGLARRHLLAACLGLAGAALLILRGDGALAGDGNLLGYGAAFACALIWSGYSVLNRTQAGVPTEAIAFYCGIVALLGAGLHVALESWVAPAPGQWLALAALGLGPVGLAFFVWDFGTKHGDLPLLGVLSYGAPVISTLLLVAFAGTPATPALLLGCALIVGAALLAMKR